MNYSKKILNAILSLLKGMVVTGKYFIQPSTIITEQYPENKNELALPERFRGELILLHNGQNKHKCTGCSACELACPNGSIKILNVTEIILDGEKQKKKKRLEKFIYRLSMCTFCNLCVESCPTSAIKFSQNFEHAVFDRTKLTNILNKTGSQLEE